MHYLSHCYMSDVGSYLPVLHMRMHVMHMYYAILFTENPTSNYAAYIPIRVYARSLTSC